MQTEEAREEEGTKEGRHMNGRRETAAQSARQGRSSSQEERYESGEAGVGEIPQASFRCLSGSGMVVALMTQLVGLSRLVGVANWRLLVVVART